MRSNDIITYWNNNDNSLEQSPSSNNVPWSFCVTIVRILVSSKQTKCVAWYKRISCEPWDAIQTWCIDEPPVAILQTCRWQSSTTNEC